MQVPRVAPDPAQDSPRHHLVFVQGIRDNQLVPIRDLSVFTPRVGEKVMQTGIIGALTFLFQSRESIVRQAERLRNELRSYINEHQSSHFTIIAHSFGTLLLQHALVDADFRDFLTGKLKNIVLCGSVGMSRAREHFGTQIYPPVPILNQIGIKDYWPVIARTFSFSRYGEAGIIGITNEERIVNHFMPLSHSGFFNDKNVKENWVPFIQGNTPPKTASLQNTGVHTSVLTLVSSSLWLFILVSFTTIAIFLTDFGLLTFNSMLFPITIVPACYLLMLLTLPFIARITSANLLRHLLYLYVISLIAGGLVFFGLSIGQSQGLKRDVIDHYLKSSEFGELDYSEIRVVGNLNAEGQPVVYGLQDRLAVKLHGSVEYKEPDGRIFVTDNRETVSYKELANLHGISLDSLAQPSAPREPLLRSFLEDEVGNARNALTLMSCSHKSLFIQARSLSEQSGTGVPVCKYDSFSSCTVIVDVKDSEVEQFLHFPKDSPEDPDMELDNNRPAGSSIDFLLRRNRPVELAGVTLAYERGFLYGELFFDPDRASQGFQLLMALPAKYFRIVPVNLPDNCRAEPFVDIWMDKNRAAVQNFNRNLEAFQPPAVVAYVATQYMIAGISKTPSDFPVARSLVVVVPR